MLGRTQTNPLLLGGDHLADLWVQYIVTLDHQGVYLAVERSTIDLRTGRLPLLRLDYRRDMPTAPAAHWNVHLPVGGERRERTLYAW